ncbi:MAG: hypothetical protein LC774_02210 [Acidobacteria bacterium]|nr:hypothetical protein [Acidobacteriota bacterium]
MPAVHLESDRQARDRDDGAARRRATRDAPDDLWRLLVIRLSSAASTRGGAPASRVSAQTSRSASVSARSRRRRSAHAPHDSACDVAASRAAASISCARASSKATDSKS